MRTTLTLIFILAAATAWGGKREIVDTDKVTCPFKGRNVFEETSEKLRSLGEGIPGLAIVEDLNPRRIEREEARQRRLEKDLDGERELRRNVNKRIKELSVQPADERAGMAIVEDLTTFKPLRN